MRKFTIIAWTLLLLLGLSGTCLAQVSVTSYQITDSSGNRAARFATGFRFVGFTFTMQNIPVNTTYRLRYYNPNNAIAADSQLISLNNSAPLSGQSVTLARYQPLNLSVQGDWKITLEINNQQKVSAPFNVGIGAPVLHSYIVTGNVPNSQANNPQEQTVFEKGVRTVGIYTTFDNMPVGSWWRVRYVRPGGSVAADVSYDALNPYSYASAIWWTYYYVNLDTTGQWKIIYDLNGQNLVTTNFTVVPMLTRMEDDKGNVVDGIVCDNLPNIPDRDKLKVSIPSFPDADFTDTQVTGPSHGSIDAQHSGYFYYYPPDEFNTNPTPESIDQVDKTSTRKVTLNLRFKSGGKSYIAGSKDIVLARPPVVLVHGINNDPHRWDGFRSNLSKYGFAFATVNHSNNSSVPLFQFGGNGFVEDGAVLLSRRIKKTLFQLRKGLPLQDNKDFDGIEDTHSPDNTAADAATYKGMSLAARRVDVVAWSYGGVITRWYLGSRGVDISHSWYQRLRSDSFQPTTFDNDIRKVITLGSMWRGVPLVNYLNETVFDSTNGILLGAAPLTPGIDTLVQLLHGELQKRGIDLPYIGNVGDLANALDKLQKPAVRVPSMEVMAVNSKWQSQLDFRVPTPTTSSVAKPFEDNVAYGSVAGDNNAYAPLWGFDPHQALHFGQLPSVFPYLSLEFYQNPEGRARSGVDYTDGLVPVWSAAIPGEADRSFKFVSSDHSSYAENQDTKDYIVRWLNNANLPFGSWLNTHWNDEIQSPILDSFAHVKTWRSQQGEMAPHVQNDVYKQIGGIGRINPVALLAYGVHGIGYRPTADIYTATVSSITSTSAVVSWVTPTEMDSTVTLNKAGIGSGPPPFYDAFPTKVHRMALKGLKPGSKYYWYVTSRFSNDIDGIFEIQSRNDADTYFQTKDTDNPGFDPKPVLSFRASVNNNAPGKFALTVTNTGGNALQCTITDLIFKPSGYTFSSVNPSFFDIPGGNSSRTFSIGYEGSNTNDPLYCQVKYSYVNVRGEVINATSPNLRIR